MNLRGFLHGIERRFVSVMLTYSARMRFASKSIKKFRVKARAALLTDWSRSSRIRASKRRRQDMTACNAMQQVRLRN